MRCVGEEDEDLIPGVGVGGRHPSCQIKHGSESHPSHGKGNSHTNLIYQHIFGCPVYLCGIPSLTHIFLSIIPLFPCSFSFYGIADLFLSYKFANNKTFYDASIKPFFSALLRVEFKTLAKGM